MSVWLDFRITTPTQDKKIWFRRQNSETHLSGIYLGFTTADQPCVRSLNGRVVELNSRNYQWRPYEPIKKESNGPKTH